MQLCAKYYAVIVLILIVKHASFKPAGMLCAHAALASCALVCSFFMGLCHNTENNEWNKWKNHFKRDVGMST